MNISPVNSTNNNLNFGIRYGNKAAWNKDILSSLEKSQLVKDIDKKYPDAFLTYIKRNLTDMDPVNGDPDYLASLVINLAKNKVSSYSMNSHTSEGADRALLARIKDLSLEDVENKSKPAAEFPRMVIEIYKKPSFLTKMANYVKNLFV